jgi:hypothetical protein
LLEHQLTVMIHAFLAFPLTALRFKRTVSFITDLLVLLNIANQKHVAILICSLAGNQMKNI